MYGMVCTRADFLHVGMVNKYMHNIGKRHGYLGKWTLKYVLGTTDVGRIF